MPKTCQRLRCELTWQEQLGIVDLATAKAGEDMRLGRLILEKRGTLGVRAAAKAAGISPATFSRVERGYPPSLKTFMRLYLWLGEDPGRVWAVTAQTRKRVRA